MYSGPRCPARRVQGNALPTMYTSKQKLRPRSAARPDLPAVRFAIVGNMRTGSSHLGSLLDSHPDIACWNNEPFYDRGAYYESGYGSPSEFLLSEVFNVGTRAVGFKLLWDAMAIVPSVWELLSELRIRAVHTWRRNRLDSFLSLQLARAGNAFTCHDGNYPSAPIYIDPDQCFQWCVDSEMHDCEIERMAKLFAVPRIEVEYSQLRSDSVGVLDFLGLPQQSLTSAMRKQRTGHQSELIRNYADLKRTFAGTRWQGMFVDS